MVSMYDQWAAMMAAVKGVHWVVAMVDAKETH